MGFSKNPPGAEPQNSEKADSILNIATFTSKNKLTYFYYRETADVAGSDVAGAKSRTCMSGPGPDKGAAPRRGAAATDGPGPDTAPGPDPDPAVAHFSPLGSQRAGPARTL